MTIFLLVFLSHYIQRTFIFPFLIRGNRHMPIVIVLMGFIFNTINVYIQGKWLFYLSDSTHYGDHWLYTPQFIVGMTLFIFGYYVNRHSDKILRNLRKDPSDSNYYIPEGGMFKYVSCPNYLGELMIWLGWTILTWSSAGLVFFLWTFANLAPRAVSSHEWYLSKFGEEYENLNRKALIPKIW